MPTGARFSLILPPPNVTGTLHIGHMLGDTVMDILVRQHRMRGETVLWVPGLDHAGLATQVRVRQALALEGVELESLSREEILAHVERWKERHEARIREQAHAAGFALDWDRYRYTMDAASERATQQAFLQLYREGLVYRGERIVNWDVKLRTAISDLEVEHSEESAELLFVRYPWADGAADGLVVATVRPETIFGDIAVAVHPDDPRHAGAVGRSVRVPLTDRVVPVIADAAVDQGFGNGALKVTPRHDLVDFEIFRRHAELPMPPDVLDDAGVLTGPWVPPRFRGLDREVARARVAGALRSEGFLVESRTYVHSVGRSERSKAVVEPRLSTQWFVRMQPLSQPVVEAVRQGEVKIYPERWNRTFFRWMEQLQDWCISRQVVWGHSIPVYYCESCETPTAAEDVPERCPNCGATRFRPDPDVLDTWMSSWLWPFSALGWPEETPELRHYYPTNVLVTGRDIMFFWVARMLMAGYHFVGARPFSDVYFTGMIRDEEGRRMAKHLGNSPDPIDVIGEWGADALRFALVFPNPSDQDGPFGETTLESARNFLTKLWNLVRFAQPFLPEGTEPAHSAPDLGPDAALEDRYILSRWAATADRVDQALAGYEFTATASALHQYLWHEVADRYVEIAKDRLQGKAGEPSGRAARATLLFVLDRALRELHPFVPHVTEELWHALPHAGDSLAVAQWPVPMEASRDMEAELAMEPVLEGVRVLRNLKAEGRWPSGEMPPAFVRPTGPEAARVLRAERATLVRLARVTDVEFLAPEATAPTGALRRVTEFGEYFVPAGAPDVDPQAPLRKERALVAELLRKTEARLGDPAFRSHAPPEVVRETEAKARELSERLERIDRHLLGPTPSGGS